MKLGGHLLIVTFCLQAVSIDASSARAQSLRKMIASRSLAAAGLPDPTCSSGVISLKTDPEAAQVCCAGYCGECSDYPTCDKVRGQDSKFACCKSEVYGNRCGAGAAANICIKSCSDSVPPCIMDKDVTFKEPNPKTRNAGSDCNTAVSGWRKAAELAKAAGTPTTPTTTTTTRWQKTDFCAKYCDYSKSQACCVNEEGQLSVHTAKPNNKMAADCRNRPGKPGIWCTLRGTPFSGKSRLKTKDVKGWKCSGANC